MSTLLLLCNQKTVSDTLTDVLRSVGHTVIVAEDVFSLRTKTAKEDPDAVIIDLPYVDALFEDIKRMSPRLPVLCWMQESDPRLAVQLMHKGIFECLCPPLENSEIVDIVHRAIERFHGKVKTNKFSPFYYSLLRSSKLIIAVCCLLVVLLGAEIVLSRRPVIERMALPYQHPTAVLWDGTSAWISNWYTQSIYRYDRAEKDLRLKGTYYFADFGPVAIARSGKYLWSVGNDLVLRQHALDERLDVLRTYRFNQYSPSGMVIDGTSLWMCDSSQCKLFKYSLGDTLTLQQEYPCPQGEPVGLAVAGEYFWIGDARTDQVYLYKRNMAPSKPEKIYQLPPLLAGRLSGIAPESEYLYAVYSGKPAQLMKYPLKTLKVVK